MSAILVTLHIIVCTALIMIVLLQTGKGSDMGAAFGGGGSQTLFGSTGASTFLSKATTVAAVVFMLTCLSLAYISGHKSGSSIMPDKAPVEEKVPTDTEAEKTSADVPADQKETPVAETAKAETAKEDADGKTEETAVASPVQSSAETSDTAVESAPLTLTPPESASESAVPAETENQSEIAVPDADKADTGEENKTN
jgi:preprotein translocase subunit SecG